METRQAATRSPRTRAGREIPRSTVVLLSLAELPALRLQKARYVPLVIQAMFGQSGLTVNGKASAAAKTPFELNLPEGEAERRKKVAVDLLMASGINPESLHEDQMNIFANQAPNLQQESLAMLQKYGAERLRIVHPENNNNNNNHGSSTSSDKSTPSKTTATPASGSTPSSSGEKRRPRKKAEGDTDASTATPKRKRVPKQTRGPCESCKATKEPCDRQKPACSRCTASCSTCVYGPPVPRKRKSDVRDARDAHAADAAGTGTADVPAAPEPAAPEPVAPEPVAPEPPVVEPGVEPPAPGQHVDEEPDDLPLPGWSMDPVQNSNGVPQEQDMSAPSMEAPSIDPAPMFSEPSSGLYRSESGLIFPRPVAQTDITQLSQGHDLSANGFVYPQSLTPPSVSTLPAQHSSTERQPAVAFSEQTAPPSTHDAYAPSGTSPRQARAKSRRSLLTEQPATYREREPASNTNASATAWQTVNNHVPGPESSSLVMAPDSTTAASSTEVSSTRPTSLRLPVQETPDPVPTTYSQSQPHAYNTTHHAPSAAAYSASSQRDSQPSPQTQTRNSPYQAAAQLALAKSRQSQRAQTLTPVQDTNLRQPVQAPAAQPVTNASTAYTSSSTAASTSGVTYDLYPQYSNTRAEPATSRLAYEPYTNQPASNANGQYQAYSYSNRSSNTASSAKPNPVSQTISASYNSTVSPTAAQWNTASTQSSHARSYSNSRGASASTSSQQAQPQILQNLNVRPQQTTRTQHSATSNQSYAQPAPSSSATAYSYPTQNSSTQQQQQQQTNWYGFSNNATNSASSSYGTRSRNSATSGYTSGSDAHGHGHGHGHGTSAYGQQQQQQQQTQTHHHNAYGLDAEHSLYGFNNAGH